MKPWIALLGATAAAACAPTQVAERAPAPSPAPVRMVQVLPPPRPIPLPPRPVENIAALEANIAALGRAFPGELGIAITDVHKGWTVDYDGDGLFPQQSVSKLWVTLAALEAVDRGTLRLTDPVTVTRADLTLFNQPIAQELKSGSLVTTIEDLIERAMIQSDNTANDILLRRIGGPEVVRAAISRWGLGQIRFGPGERLLQSRVAGISWRDSYSIGNGFYAARSAVPASQRQAALDAYLRDPIDGASPAAITGALARLKKNELVSRPLAEKLISIMQRSKTGPQRLKGGVPAGWLFAHKTGTGQVLGATGTGYNDVALVTAPDGTAYSVAVMIGSTRAGIPERQQLMQNVMRTLASHKQRQQWANGLPSWQAGNN